MRYTKKRVYEWSPHIAYSVGLMASDGSLTKDGRHLDLTSVDLDQLANFCAAIGRDIFVGRKTNMNLQPSYRVQFGDVAYYDFLLQAGLTPAKSLTMPALNIPEAFYADFLRGLFDGDGSTYAYMDPRWKSSYMFYTLFTSASLAFISYLRAINTRLADVSPGSIDRHKNAYTLRYAKADSHKIYKFMYHSTDILSLARKRTKLEGFILRDQSVIMT